MSTAADRNFVRFTRSSIILPPAIWRELELKHGGDWLDAHLNDVNGSGMLYAYNKTGIRGDFTLDKIRDLHMAYMKFRAVRILYDNLIPEAIENLRLARISFKENPDRGEFRCWSRHSREINYHRGCIKSYREKIKRAQDELDIETKKLIYE
jgi:hypothetical protein